MQLVKIAAKKFVKKKLKIIKFYEDRGGARSEVNNRDGFWYKIFSKRIIEYSIYFGGSIIIGEKDKLIISISSIASQT
jgi:hypothetical protein